MTTLDVTRKYVSTTVAARRLGVTPLRVRQLIIYGTLKATRMARDWRVDEEALRALIEEREAMAARWQA